MSEHYAARYLGPRNTDAVVGHSWRWTRDHAKEWGVAVLRVDGKSLIRAEEFFAALEARATIPSTPQQDEADELARMRESVRRAG